MINVYNIRIVGTIDAADNAVNQLGVNLNNRKAEIKSISWFLNLYRGVQVVTTPLEKITDAFYQLSVGDHNIKISKDFDRIALAAGAGYDTNTIHFFQPGQYFFSSFFVTNYLPLEIEIGNRDAINVLNYNFVVIIETNEKY